MLTYAREDRKPATDAADHAHVFDSYTAVLLCLAVLFAFGLGYSMGKTQFDKGQTSFSQPAHPDTYGRFGHVR